MPYCCGYLEQLTKTGVKIVMLLLCIRGVRHCYSHPLLSCQSSSETGYARMIRNIYILYIYIYIGAHVSKPRVAPAENGETRAVNRFVDLHRKNCACFVSIVPVQSSYIPHIPHI